MDRLTAMEVLVRVAETGSFSGAARLLRVGQPAVSKTIAQLEERLGVSLLLRSSRGLAPTEAGQNFYERAKRSIEEADEAEVAARDAGAGLAGRLRFSSGITFGRLHIIPRLPLFLAAHPELTVEAILGDRPVDLIEEGVAVGFRMGMLADSTIVARRIGQARRLVGSVPDGPPRLREGARLRCLHRESAAADQLREVSCLGQECRTKKNGGVLALN